MGFPGGSDGKESACSAGDPGWIPGLGKSPGEANGNPLQYSCLENPRDGGVWQATSMGSELNTNVRLTSTRQAYPRFSSVKIFYTSNHTVHILIFIST